MRGRNLKPARVYQTASSLLTSKSIFNPPPWYETIGTLPPGEILTRTQPPQHRAQKPSSSRVRKPSKLFRPQPLEYAEDALRREFFADHPWELARPRIILEDNGKDGQGLDWSQMRQRGRPLTGESVVQRQLWLMDQGLPKAEAYDMARKEFYGLRLQEEVEQKVQREEALWTGAQFGKGVLEIGMQLEDKEYEKWKMFATKEVQAQQTRLDAANATTDPGEEEEEDDTEVNTSLGAA